MFGWWGKGLEVDLGNGEIVVKQEKGDMELPALAGQGKTVLLLPVS